jgi:hypothetical protein
MPPPTDILLGPLTKTISNGAKWLPEDDFPSCQEWADEVERVLEYLLAHGHFERFLPRLRDEESKHRDSKLTEARISFFLFRNGFRILEYDPPGANGSEGDLTVQWQSTNPIFVEIKNPSWHGELRPREEEEKAKLTGPQRGRIKKRMQEPKYIDGDAKWIDPVGLALSVVERNALKKLHDDRPSLVVVLDDLFVTVVENPNLEAIAKSRMSAPAFERLGGILFLNPNLPAGASEVHYDIAFAENECALPPCRLPNEVATGFAKSAHECRRKRRLERAELNKRRSSEPF